MKRVPPFQAWIIAMILLSARGIAQTEFPLNLFVETTNGLLFRSDAMSIASDRERGWVSLKVGPNEFWHTDAHAGALVFQNDSHWFSYFPLLSVLSHDDWVGRAGSVADGIRIIKISPDWHRPEFELYFGANDPNPGRAIMFFSDDVVLLRTGHSHNRPWMQTVLRPTSTERRKSSEFLAVHRNGTALVIRSIPKQTEENAKDQPSPELEAGLFPHPSGKSRLAIAFSCRGFAPNRYHLLLDPVPREENFVLRPRFDVRILNEPDEPINGQGATRGVGRPIYGPNTQLDFGLVFDWVGPHPFQGYAELEIVHSLGKPHFSERVLLDSRTLTGTGTTYRAVFHPVFHLPGVSEVWGRLVGSDNRLIWIGRYRMGYDLEHYRPNLLILPDFDAFWNQTLAELRAIPLESETERVADLIDHPAFEIFHVRYNSWGGQRIHAMLFVPKTGHPPYPAMITAHPNTRGYGVRKQTDGTFGSELRHDPRFVTIVPLIRGHAPDAPDIPFNHPWWGPLDSRDEYVARRWYCAMVRAIDYLASRPDLVDLRRLMARGGSQGGALALIAAALDPRVTVCIADCPALCQPHEILENYPSFGPTMAQVPPSQTLEDLKRMLSYYNPVNFCPRIRCPTYIGSNIGDLTVHSMGPLAAYHNLTGLPADQKAFFPGNTHFHGSGPGLAKTLREWSDRLAGSSSSSP